MIPQITSLATNARAWHQKLSCHTEGFNLGIKTRLQYGFQDSDETLHLFIEFDPLSDACVHDEAAVRNLMLRIFPIVNSIRPRVRVVSLPTLHSKLFWLYSVANYRLRVNQKYGAGLETEQGDIGGVHFSALMASINLSQALVVRRDTDYVETTHMKTRFQEIGHPYVGNGHKEFWGSPHQPHTFAATGLGSVFEKSLSTVSQPEGAWWIYYISIQKFRASKATAPCYNNFFKSNFIHGARVQLLTSGGTSQCYHLLLAVNMPVPAADMRVLWGAQWGALNTGAEMVDFIPVEPSGSLDFIRTLFAHEACKDTAMYTDCDQMYSLCNNITSAFSSACQDPFADKKRMEYLASKLFKGRRSPLINTETEKAMRINDPKFFMAVFHRPGRLTGFTDQVTMMGRLHLMAAPRSSESGAVLTYSAVHDACHPLRVFCNVKPVGKSAASVTPQGSSESSPSCHKQLSPQQDYELWMSAFQESPRPSPTRKDGDAKGKNRKQVADSAGPRVKTVAYARITAPLYQPPGDQAKEARKDTAVDGAPPPVIHAVCIGSRPHRFLQTVECTPIETDAQTVELLTQMIQAEQAIGRVMSVEHGELPPSPPAIDQKAGDVSALVQQLSVDCAQGLAHEKHGGTSMEISSIINCFIYNCWE